MDTPLGPHPPDDDLRRFATGQLDDAATAAVARHLDTCPGCRRRVAEVPPDEFVARLQDARPDPDRTAPAAPPPTAPDPPGTVVADRYKLLEVIGEGGMGTVWMAEQTQPVKRKVAVKLIKAGMDSRPVLARFEAERQALARMDHPNIATVLDAGAMADGRPFFALELVRGVPITRFCDDRRLPPADRLALFAPVCDAVQHAHQKGVIHRDIKPSNVLVALYDGRPVPKVIDFGVAKAVGEPLAAGTAFTGFGAVVGTPEYMSPEQAELNQLDIDTRSDVYALGVLLYELLTGAPPFPRTDLGRAGLLEVLRVIREEEPARPSARLSSSDALPSLATVRGTEPRRLTALVRGELDWIVMKALEKDRDRRYESAAGLAADVRRHLAGEPVAAAPPGRAYRVRKFARRHRGPLAAAGLVAVALVGGITGTAVGLVRANRAAVAETEQRRAAEKSREQALKAFRELAALSGYLNNVAIQQEARGDVEAAAASFRRLIAAAEQAAADQSGQAEFRMVAAFGHLNLADLEGKRGDRAGAKEAYRQGIAALERLAADQPAVPTHRRFLGQAYSQLGNLEALSDPAAALPWHDKAVQVMTAARQDAPANAVVGQQLRNAHVNRANVFDALGRHAEAVADWDQAIELSPKGEQPLYGFKRMASELKKKNQVKPGGPPRP